MRGEGFAGAGGIWACGRVGCACMVLEGRPGRKVNWGVVGGLREAFWADTGITCCWVSVSRCNERKEWTHTVVNFCMCAEMLVCREGFCAAWIVATERFSVWGCVSSGYMAPE